MPETPAPRRGIVADDGPDPVDDAEGTGPAPQPSPPGAEEVAEQPDPEATSPSVRPRQDWRAHLRAFFRPGRGQLVVALMLALTSMLVVLTLRTQASQPDYSNLRREELIQLLDNVAAETRRLEDEVRDLQTTRDRLASGAEGAQEAQAQAERRLETLQIIGGTVPVEGRGVRITVSDPQAKVSPELLLDALEELRDAGAEVIELNDSVRVVASTWLGLDTSGRIVADGTVLDAPFVIEVIGDPPTLEAGARFRGGLVSEIEGPRVEGSVVIEQLELVEVESVVVATENEYALPN